MKQPPGFVGLDQPFYVCKLQNSLYGLKQALRAWFAKLSDKLLLLGFTCSVSNSSLFVLRRSFACVFVLVYVDDSIVTESDFTLISQFINFLSSSFLVKNLGPYIIF